MSISDSLNRLGTGQNRVVPKQLHDMLNWRTKVNVLYLCRDKACQTSSSSICHPGWCSEIAARYAGDAVQILAMAYLQ